MPAFSVTGSADPIEDEDGLFALLKDLAAQGWGGAVEYGSDEIGDAPTYKLKVFTADASEPSGARKLRADIGDIKVVIGSTISVLTPSAYEAAYGG